MVATSSHQAPSCTLGPVLLLASCLIASLLGGCKASTGPAASKPTTLSESPSTPSLIAHKPGPERVMRSTRGDWGLGHAPYMPTGAMPVYAFMHGMGDTPAAECPWFESVTRTRGYLLCPKGNAAYGNGFAWTNDRAQVRERFDGAWTATDNLVDYHVARPTRRKNTLMGFSNGAWAAAETALAQPGEWQQLVLIAMKVSLDATKLRGAGIERVVLAAGDHDGSAHSMQSEAKKLNAAGLPALYLSLGKVGHTFPRDMPSRMETALQWLESPQNEGDRRVTQN